MKGRPRFDGTPAQPRGLGKYADDPKLYRREWARARREDPGFRERENAAERERTKQSRLRKNAQILGVRVSATSRLV